MTRSPSTPADKNGLVRGIGCGDCSADFETQRRAGYPIEYRPPSMTEWHPCHVPAHMPLDKSGHWEFRLKPNIGGVADARHPEAEHTSK